jgi:hypothetical protein
LLVLLLPLSSHAKFDPAFIWSTLETDHFLIHYHQDGEAIARKAAAIAEDVHERLVPRLRWEPKDKTHLVLVDARRRERLPRPCRTTGWSSSHPVPGQPDSGDAVRCHRARDHARVHPRSSSI